MVLRKRLRQPENFARFVRLGASIALKLSTISSDRNLGQVVDFLQQYKSAMIETWDMIPTELDIEQGITGPFSTPAALGALLKVS